MISGVDGIRAAYQDEGVARRYVDERFRTPLGALLHDRQSQVLRTAISAQAGSDVLEIAPGPARLTTGVIRCCRATDARRRQCGNARRSQAPSLCGRCRHAIHVGPWRCVLPAIPVTFRSRVPFRLIRHFGAEDRLRLYREAARVLKPGGRLVFDAVNERVYEPMRTIADGKDHYDASVDRQALRAELAAAGFEVESLAGAQHRYAILHRLQVLVAPRSAKLARLAMNVVDRFGGGEPLEWIVICRRV